MPQKKVKRRLKKLGVVLLSLYIMVGSLLYLFQEKLLFRPTVLPQDFKYEFSYPFEELFLKTEDKAVINAIHFKIEHSKGVVLYFHGNAGDLSRWGGIAENFVAGGYDVLVMDYRTYGKSTGVLSERAFYLDGQFCYNYLKEQYPEDSITIYGRSLGTGVATYLASKNSPKSLVLETPYYSIGDVAKHRFPIYPVERLLKYQFPTYQFIEEVKCPISIFHGNEDAVVPLNSAQKLYGVAPQSNTTFVEIDGGNHHNLIDFDGYQIQMKKVLP